MTDEEVVLLHEWLIKKVASKFYGVNYDDLYQAGALGIIKAYRHYEKNMTTKFSTYAYDYVYGEMYQMVCKSQQLKMSRDTLKLYRKIETSRSLLAQKLNKMPSNEEVALFLEMDCNFLEEVLCASRAILCSLDDDSSNLRNLSEVVSQKEDVLLDDKIMLKESFQVLNPEEKKIISYRYFKDYTQCETAKKLNMTQVMVSRYEKKGLHKMRDFYRQVS